MSIREINRMSKRYDTLTPEEKEKLKEGILNNDKARSVAINGALSNDDFQLAVVLTLYRSKR